MLKISEPFFFCDFDDDTHGTRVFGLAEPGKPNDLYVRLEKSFSATVAAPQIPTGATRRVTGNKTRKRQAVRRIELNAVRLKDGELASIPERELIYAISGVDGIENFSEVNGCESCGDECHGDCDDEVAGGSIVAVKVGVDVE